MTTPFDKRGLALISVIVAVAILTCALTMAVSAFVSAARLTRHAANFTAASNFAEGVMERVKAEPFAGIKTAEVRSGLSTLPQAACTVNVKPAGDGLKEVAVACSWVEAGQRREVRFSTLVAMGGAR